MLHMHSQVSLIIQNRPYGQTRHGIVVWRQIATVVVVVIMTMMTMVVVVVVAVVVIVGVTGRVKWRLRERLSLGIGKYHIQAVD